MEDLVDKKLNPVHFLRFEDLLADPVKELEGVMQFLLAEPTLEGMNVQKRIQEIVAKGPEASETYKTKSTTRQPNSQAARYTDAQKERISIQNSRFLHFFGYASAPEGHEPNPTGFFDFAADRNADLTSAYYQFRANNEFNLKKVTKGAQTQTFANHGR